MGLIENLVFRIAKSPRRVSDSPPLLTELFPGTTEVGGLRYEKYPFCYIISETPSGNEYSVQLTLGTEVIRSIRNAVREVSESLDPREVQPLSFDTLIEVLKQHAAPLTSNLKAAGRLGDLVDLVAYEAVGLSRLYALAKDEGVSEIFVDSDTTPVYLDHVTHGRCGTAIVLSERERKAIETHMDTFRGYSLDFGTPSLKNDIELAGARLRISLDLDPLSVNRFSLDVRRLNATSFSLRNLISSDVLSLEAGAFLVAWLELGGNVVIVGETGTGKTTLLNALDTELDSRLRRVYIEDAVETRDLLSKGYRQLKLKVSPLDRGGRFASGKETEIIKVLHRSPDLVILSEIQAEEHSRAFFHALAAGIRGMQTFHASSAEQAVRRWVSIHGIPEASLLDVGLMVQTCRPEKLGSRRLVSRICAAVSEGGKPRIRDIFLRSRTGDLVRVADWDRIEPPPTSDNPTLSGKTVQLCKRLGP